MERRNGYIHEGIVYAWAFPRLGVVKVGHTVATVKDRRGYAKDGVYEYAHEWEEPYLAFQIRSPKPADLESFICKHLLQAPVIRREFFPISALPAIVQLLRTALSPQFDVWETPNLA